MDPALVDDFNVDPALFLRTVGLDPVESWAVLTRQRRVDVGLCAVRQRCGAAVAWGLATTEERRAFVVASDGRLMAAASSAAIPDLSLSRRAEARADRPLLPTLIGTRTAGLVVSPSRR